MSQLNIEHLLQAMSQRSDRTLAGPGRIGPTDPAFGDHLARVTTPNDPPRKTDPRPTTEPVATPDSSPRADNAQPRDADDSASNARTEDDATNSPLATNDTAGSSQKDNDEAQPAPETDSAQNTAESNGLDTTKNDRNHADDDGSSDDSDDSEKTSEAATLINAQAVAQSTKTQPTARGKALVEQDTSADTVVASTKSLLTGDNSKTATKQTGATTVKTELAQNEEATPETATNAAKDGEKTAAVERNGVPAPRKKDSHRAGKTDDGATDGVAKTAGRAAKQVVKDEAVNCVTEAAVKSPVESERNSERPSRSNRSSAKKERAGGPDITDESANEPAQNAPRAANANSNNAPAGANSAAGVAAAVDATKTNSSENPAPFTQKASISANSPADGLVNSLGRLQRGSNRAASSDRQSESTDTPQVDVARFVGRVSKAFQTAQQRGGTLHLRLSPPELGALRLELSVKDGAMTAALHTETDAARRVLLDHLPALRERLAEQNIRIERFDVDVRREDNSGQADGRMLHHQQQRQQEQPSHNPTPRRAARATVSAGAAETVPSPIMIGDGSGLNVVA